MAYRLFNVAEPTWQRSAKASEMNDTLKDLVRERGVYLEASKVLGFQKAKEPGNPCCYWVCRLLHFPSNGLTVRRSTD